MSLEKIRSDFVERVKAANRVAALECEGCPNLEETTSDIGRVILTCQLEKATRDGVTAGTLKDVLNPQGTPTGTDVADIGEKMDQANEDCPIVEGAVSQLLQARSYDKPIDFAGKLPSPLVTGEQAASLDF